ncbi:MAG: N-acetyl-D-Glu racemase DgcA [Rhodothalassiaceae bacterium]
MSGRHRIPPDIALPRLTLCAEAETWPLAAPFVISRGTKTAAEVIVATVTGGGSFGRGEAVPYARYGETVAATLAALRACAPALEQGLDWRALGQLLPPGAARNALDCALWDWTARRSGTPAWSLAGVAAPVRIPSFFTISLDSPEAMAAAAAGAAERGLGALKIKLGEPRADAARLAAIRAEAPETRLIVDANEGWTMADLRRLAPLAAGLGVELIEQPLPAAGDAPLAGFQSPVPLCADESFHGSDGLAALRDRYQAVNIKLDKAGGLSTALALGQEARRRGLDILVGSMVATSLGVAPALLLAPMARWVDLDGPLLLAPYRVPGLDMRDGIIDGLPAGLWGSP